MARPPATRRRKSIPAAVVAQVLIESRRRCCLCFYLEKKTGVELQGQIAHIDRDSANFKESNLTYLCIPHHDTYDSTPRQSRGLTSNELLHAKKALYDWLTQQPVDIENAIVTITINGDIERFEEKDKACVLELIAKAGRLNGGVKIVNVEPGSIKLTLEMGHEDAVKLCRAFSERRLPTVTRVEVPQLPTNMVVASALYDEKKAGLPLSHAMDVVHAPDQIIYLSGDRQVPIDKAVCGLYTKRFNKRDPYTVIAITSFDAFHTNRLYAALKADHRFVNVAKVTDPLSALKAFLQVYGVPIFLPGLGRSSLFLGGRVTSPTTVVSDRDAMRFITTRAYGQVDEPFGMISNFKVSEISGFIRVFLIAFYATRRYLRDLRR